MQITASSAFIDAVIPSSVEYELHPDRSVTLKHLPIPVGDKVEHIAVELAPFRPIEYLDVEALITGAGLPQQLPIKPSEKIAKAVAHYVTDWGGKGEINPMALSASQAWAVDLVWEFLQQFMGAPVFIPESAADKIDGMGPDEAIPSDSIEIFAPDVVTYRVNADRSMVLLGLPIVASLDKLQMVDIQIAALNPLALRDLWATIGKTAPKDQAYQVVSQCVTDWGGRGELTAEEIAADPSLDWSASVVWLFLNKFFRPVRFVPAAQAAEHDGAGDGGEARDSEGLAEQAHS